jgi:C-terminal processing protease CtpA/Prc
MQEQRRATVIGTHPTTCGCLLGVSQTIRLSDGGKLNVSDTDFRTNLGRRIEGRGVRPDLVVAIRTSDLLLSNDLPLQSATDLLGRQIVFGDRYGTVDFTIRLPRDELTLSPGLSQY